MSGQELAAEIRKESTAKIFLLPGIAGADVGTHEKANGHLEERLQAVRDRLAGGDKAKTIGNLSQALEKVQEKLTASQKDVLALRERLDHGGAEGTFAVKLLESLTKARIQAEELSKTSDAWQSQIDCLKDEQASELNQAIRDEAMSLLCEIRDQRNTLVEELIAFIRDRREKWHFVETITSLARRVVDYPASKMQRPLPIDPPQVVPYQETLGDGLHVEYAPLTEEELATA